MNKLAKANSEARKRGLTYGQYQARLMGGGVLDGKRSPFEKHVRSEAAKLRYCQERCENKRLCMNIAKRLGKNCIKGADE